MKKRILSYRNRIDEIIEKDSPDTDWKDLMEEHLKQIEFFQHERLIHLMVTLTFALLAILSLILAYVSTQIATFALFFVILILLIPYIKHYYLMENKCQEMLKQYDEIWKKVKEERRNKEASD